MTIRERIEQAQALLNDEGIAIALLDGFLTGEVILADEVDARIEAAVREAVLAEREAAWRKAVIHSNYPIETDWERGYNAGRLDAGKAIKDEPSHTRDPSASAETGE